MKTLALLTLVTLSLNSYAQLGGMGMSPSGANGGAMPSGAVGASGGIGGNLNLDFLNFRPGECAFQGNLQADDLSLLGSAASTLRALKSNDKCQAVAADIDTFNKALQDYQAQMGIDRAGGYDGNVNVNCANYENIYDIMFEHFSANWSGATTASSTDTYTDPMLECQSAATREDAISCAATKVGSLKSKKRTQCDLQKSSLSTRQKETLTTDTYTTALKTFQALLNNQECVDASGSQRLGIIQQAVSLAGRAASLSSVGTPMGLAISAGTDLINSVIGRLFKTNNRDALQQLEDEQNFEKLACLYEKLENKSIQCERRTASREVEDTAKMYQEAQSCYSGALNAYQNGISGFLAETERIKAAITAPAANGQAAAEFSDSDLISMLEQFERRLPGTNQTFLETVQSAASDNISRLSNIIGNEVALKDIAIKRGIDPKQRAKLMAINQEMVSELERNKKVQGVMASIKGAYDKGFSVGASDKKAVEDALKGFSDSTLGLTGAVNSVLVTKASFGGDDLSESLRAYNARVNQAQQYASVIQRYQARQRVANAEFNDNGQFEIARSGLAPYLSKMMERKLDKLWGELKNMSSVQKRAPSASEKEELRRKEETVVAPIVLACNQLRTVMAQEKRGRDITNQHQACSALQCGQGRGIQSPLDYLRANGVGSPSSSCTDVTCAAQYNRFICQETQRYPSIRNQFKNELLSSGTMCGKSISEIVSSK